MGKLAFACSLIVVGLLYAVSCVCHAQRATIAELKEAHDNTAKQLHDLQKSYLLYMELNPPRFQRPEKR